MIKKSLLAASIATALSTAIISPVVYADNTSGAVRGTVQDGAGATVVVTDESRGVSRSYEVTDGRFQFRSLQPGTYKVTVVRDGAVVDSQEVNVALGGESNLILAGTSAAVEEVVVMGSRLRATDTALAEQGIVITADELAVLPVSRDLNSVALLAPGVSRGDTAFGSNVSFSGSSVAENTTYVNGLNITNFRNGLGFSEVPFEAYEQFEVKSGGYGAKYGRSTGGVINTIVRSGSNDFQAGVSAYYEHEMGDKEETYFSNTERNTWDEGNFNLWASGAIIEDRLFFYGLAQQKQYNAESYGKLSDRSYVTTTDTMFWLANITGHITDNHRVEFLAFNDEADYITNTYEYDYPTDAVGAFKGESVNSTGGMNWVATYVGQLTQDLEVQVKVGQNEQNRTSLPATAVYPVVYNYNNGFQAQGPWTDFSISEGKDTREMARIDLTWDLGDHVIEAGIDTERNTTVDETKLSGGVYYLKDPTGAYNAWLLGGQPNYRQRTYLNGGSFDVDTSAIYISDTWRVTDHVTIEAGIRNETFTNYNAAGEEFVSMENQWAPRLSVRWDVNDDINMFANWGLYYLPVASNTNARLSGGETYIHDYYAWDGVSEDPVTRAPTNGGALLDTIIYADGSVPDTRSLTDVNIEPMYQSEIMVGMQYMLNDDWTFGVMAVHRNLETSIEDVAIDAAVIDYYDNGPGNWDASLVGGDSVQDVFSGFHQYVLTNPGNDMRIYIPEMDEFIDLSADRLNYPEAERKYTAVELSFNRAFNDNWSVSGSYVWAKNEGNNEGYVRSDNGQDDAGLTTNFDQPGLTDFAYGPLPNDRRHTFKAYGLYQFDMGLNVSANFVFQTGRPKNCFGVHPTDGFAAQYGAESFYCYNPDTGVSDPSPRGSKGRTENQWSLDLGANYTFDLNHSELRVGLDVFNIFHNQAVTEVNEIEPLNNPYYGMPTSYQFGRYARLNVSYTFL